MPTWDFPRTPTTTRMLVDVGIAHGATTADCLRGTGLTADDLAGDREIEAAHELAVARNLIAAVGDLPGLGVETGLRYTLSSAGILGFALLASPTLRDAITIGLRYLALSSAFVRLALEDAGTHARVVFDDGEIPEDVRPFLVERDLAAVGRILPLLLDVDPASSGARVELRLDTQRSRALAATLPGLPVIAARPRNLITFPRELLDRALPQADPDTAAMCERQCADLLNRRQHRRGTAAQVRAALLRDPSDMPSMDTVAEQLHLDPRTLHRRLEREATSFRALAAEIRETVAIELLTSTGLTVDETAHRLGYSEVAAFSRAFKRWTGQPPATTDHEHQSALLRRERCRRWAPQAAQPAGSTNGTGIPTMSRGTGQGSAAVTQDPRWSLRWVVFGTGS